MSDKPVKIFAINGSVRAQSANLKILNLIGSWCPEDVHFSIFNGLAELPHFNPDLASENTPEVVVNFRKDIEEADGLMICTPEYVFSLPASLKNCLEWCVATVILSEKPVATITAAASGEKAHESLVLILKTLGATLDQRSQLLIQGVKSKVNADGEITDEDLTEKLKYLVNSFVNTVRKKM